MAELNPVFIVIFLVIGFLVFFLLKRTNTRYKPSALKKDELIKKYEYEMLKVISKYENDKELLSKKKIEFLKIASNELHNNIFFDEHEATAIIKKLASF